MRIDPIPPACIPPTQKFLSDTPLPATFGEYPWALRHNEYQDAAIFFGTRPGSCLQRFVGKAPGKDGHVLVVGGAGSGKSSCIAIPTLRNWPGTFVAIDVKGDLLQNAASFAEAKHPLKVFSFSKNHPPDRQFARFDPFYLLREDIEDNLVQNAREIAQAIIPVPPNVHDPFWPQSAQNVLTAVLLYTYGLCAVDDSTGETLRGTFNDAMEYIQSKSIGEIVKDICESGNTAAIKHIRQFNNIKFSEDDKILAGIAAELSSKVMTFATDNRIQAAFTSDGDTMKWEDLETHNIILRIPEDKLDQWSGALTLILTQLIRTLERRPDKFSGGKPLPPVLLLLDEFPRLGKLDVIQSAVSTLRSKGVTICLIVQSISQLDYVYGQEVRQILLDNCAYKALLSVSDSASQQMFSAMIGSFEAPKRSFGASLSGGLHGKFPFISISPSISTSVSSQREPAIHPHELATLKDIVLLHPEGFCRVEKVPYYQIPFTVPAPKLNYFL